MENEEDPPVRELTALPPELLSLVLARLDAESLAHAASSCSVLARVEQAHGEHVWEAVCKEHLDAFKVVDDSAPWSYKSDVPYYRDVSPKIDCMVADLGMAWKDVYRMHCYYVEEPEIDVEAINERFEFLGMVMITGHPPTDGRCRTVQLRLDAIPGGEFGFNGDSADDCLAEWPQELKNKDSGLLDGNLDDTPLLDRLLIYVRDKGAKKVALLMSTIETCGDEIDETDDKTVYHFQVDAPEVWFWVAGHPPEYARVTIPFVDKDQAKWSSSISVSGFEGVPPYDGAEELEPCTVKTLREVLNSPRMHWVPCGAK
jgi:hypothetical protein